MKNENAKTVSIAEMARNLNLYAQRLFEVFVMWCCCADGATLIQDNLKVLRAQGGLARKYASIMQSFLVLFAGWYPANGDEPAGFVGRRTKKQCEQYANKAYQEAFKELNASRLTKYGYEKEDKPIDLKAQCLKALGGWSLETLAFIRTHKAEIKALMQATPKS